MTNPIVVIVGLLVGVLGAALIAGPTLGWMPGEGIESKG